VCVTRDPDAQRESGLDLYPVMFDYYQKDRPKELEIHVSNADEAERSGTFVAPRTHEHWECAR